MATEVHVELTDKQVAASWLKYARHLTLVGNPPPVGQPLYLTLIASGAPPPKETDGDRS